MADKLSLKEDSKACPACLGDGWDQTEKATDIVPGKMPPPPPKCPACNGTGLIPLNDRMA
jgi:DnaJ-class molecular chaperone